MSGFSWPGGTRSLHIQDIDSNVWEKLPVIPTGSQLFLMNFHHNSSLELLLKENFALKTICRLNLILGMYSCPRRVEGRK